MKIISLSYPLRLERGVSYCAICDGALYRRGKVRDVEVKSRLARALNNFLDPIRERRRYFASQEGKVREILMPGTEVVRQEARKTLKSAKEAIGLVFWENAKA